jgi:hypothetical protein
MGVQQLHQLKRTEGERKEWKLVVEAGGTEVTCN